LIGTSNTNTILDGNQKDSCIKISQGINVFISRLTITNGSNDYLVNADGIYLGGGIDNEGGNLTLDQVIISNNFATDKGGGIYNTGTLTINNCTFDGNKVQNYHNNFGGDKTGKANGAGIYNTGTLTITNTTFTNQDAYDTIHESGRGLGGAIYSNSTTTLSITNCTFKSNNADDGGGAICAIGTGAFNVLNSTFQSNKAYYAILEGDQADLYKNECYGAGIYTTCNLTVTNSIFKSNVAFHGGAIYCTGALNVSNSTFQSNRAFYAIQTLPGLHNNNCLGGYGGAIYHTNNLNLTNCTFTSNNAIFGGAIYSKGTGNITISNTTFTNNKVQAIDENGNEIIYNTIDMTAYQVTKTILAYAQAIVQFTYDFRLFTGSSISIVLQTTSDMINKVTTNTIQATGGAIYLSESCNLNVNNCTFHNDTAAIGGAINNLGNGTITINNSNFKNNAAGLGGAIYSSNIGSLFVKNCLFDSNIGGNNGAIFFGGTTSNLWAECNINHNIFKNNTAVFGTIFYNGINGESHSYFNFNQIYGTNCYDIFNEYELNKINANYNWWGSNDGPGTYSTYSKFNLNVDTSHYMVLTINNPTDMTYGENIPITVDILHDNNGTYQDPAYGIIPDGIKVNLTTTNGTITPGLVTLVNGISTATYYANGGTGLAEIRAAVDNEKHPTKATIDIQKIPTTTHNIYSQYNGTVDSNITFTAKVTDKYNKLVNEGTVTFKVGTTDLTTNVVNGIAEYIWTLPTSTGTFSIYTTYNGDSIYASSTDPYQSQLVVSPYLATSHLTITKKVQSIIYLGQNFLITIKVGNKGPDIAKDVTIKIPIPIVFKFINAKVDQGTWSFNKSTNTLTWNIGDVPVGDPYLYLTLKPTRLGQYIFNYLITTATYDPNIGQQITKLTLQIKTPNNQQKKTNKTSSLNRQNIPMQKTGAPLVALFLALIFILGGSVYGKLR